MNPSTKPASANPIAELKKHMKPYEKTDSKTSVLQLFNTLIPLILFWVGGYMALSVSYWLALPLLLVASGFVIRTFIIFHDCTHGSFFKNKKANDIVGTITGVITIMPYRKWKYSHTMHHATSSNLDKRGEGDMWLLTTEEYAKASFWTRLAYRFYRNPLVMFGIGPIFVFLIQGRFNRKGAKALERRNTYLTNILLVGLYGALIWAMGWQAFVLVQGPVFFFSGMLGIWLFYVQHQFEDSYFEHEEEWSYVNAAVEGSSYYKLPKPLQWITGNIGFHHVHHLSPKVPNYNLEKAHDSSIPLQKATTITLRTSLKSLNFRLWDEETKTFTGYGRKVRSGLPKNAVQAVARELKPKAPAMPKD